MQGPSPAMPATSDGDDPASMADICARSASIFSLRWGSNYFFPFGFAAGVMASASSADRVATGMS